MSTFRDLLARRRKKETLTVSDFNLREFPEIESLTPEERSVLFDILREVSETGTSELLSNLWKYDYEEIPVDIETFICDPLYLGRSTNEGRAIYPFWLETLKRLYSPDAKYFECILSGAIGIGKTTIANIGISYMLYKLLCLRDPQSYYQLIPGDKIIIAFFNITLELSQGVAFQNLQSMLKESPWFLDRGNITGRTHPIYTPGKNIDFRIGSTSGHGLGQNIFCLFKGTEIITTGGIVPIETVVDKDLWVYSYNPNGDVIISDKCTVKESGFTNEVVEIEFENGFIVKCTPDHQWLLKSEEGLDYYCPAESIRTGDNIVSV